MKGQGCNVLYSTCEITHISVKYILLPKLHVQFVLDLFLMPRFTMLITLTTHALEIICLCDCLVLLLMSYFITTENPCTYNPDDQK